MIVVIGGTGFIGSKVVAKLGEDGHEAVAASRETGVNTLTGEGLADALAGAAVLIDVSNAQGLRVPQCWSSSKRPPGTCSPPRSLAFVTTSRCRWWVATDFPTAATSVRRSRKPS
jgi:NAD dependent epimerase/dehydratase family